MSDDERDHPNFEELVAAALPAPAVRDAGGWVLRHAGGATLRTNSVLPHTDPGALDAAMERVERFYADRGRPVVFCVSERSRPSGLDAALADRGYTRDREILVMARDIAASGPGPDGVGVDGELSPEWLRRLWSVENGQPDELPVAAKMLASVPAGYASAEGLAAVGRGVPQGPWLGIYSMAVAPEARRRGLARRVLRALQAWGREQGCRRAYLAVVESNAAARALYESEGFRTVDRYHYRVKAIAASA